MRLFRVALSSAIISLFVPVLVTVSAQEKPTKRVIAGRSTLGARSVYAADIDSDGNADVIVASFDDGKVSWYKNLGSSGLFSKQKVITKNADGAAAVHVADLDGDGDNDVISGSYENLSNSGDNKLAWYENKEDGGFSDQKVIDDFFSDDGVLSVFAADINDNGLKDIIVAVGDGLTSGEIGWYKNEGDGSFSSDYNLIADDIEVESVYAGDPDGDSDMDVLSKSSEEEIAWYLNSDGSFSGNKKMNVPGGSEDLYYADIDGDGTRDVLSSSRDKVSWYKISDEPDATFSWSNEKIVAEDVDNAESIYPADLDGDSDLDVLSAERGTNKISAYENKGEEGFTELVITTEANEARSVHAADFYGDGDPDVVAASSGDDKIALHENQISEGGGFNEPDILTSKEKSLENLSSVHAVDLTGDGAKDILSTSYIGFEESGRDKIAWYENLGGGSFSKQKVITNNANGARTVHASDLDVDGNKDIVFGSSYYTGGRGRDQVAWIENEGEGSFSDKKVFVYGPSDPDDEVSGVVSIHTADIDGDNFPDVLSVSEDLDKVSWYENDGNGNFSDQKVINVPDPDGTLGDDGNADAPQSVYAADLDGDGDEDVLSASENDDKIAWYENINGEGSFSDQKVITTDASGAQSVHTGDIDGDEDQDVFAAGANEITWYENDGNGSFSEQKQVSQGLTSVRSVRSAYLDLDGKVEILSGSSEGLIFHKMSSSFGSISFEDENIDPEGTGDIYVSDLDGDGDLDLLAGLDNSTVAWYENTEGTLPVEIARFQATLTEEGPRLAWTTASEINNAGFRVQRRSEGSSSETTWHTIGHVEGQGTATDPTSYRFTDENPPYEANRLTYRLKQVDTDGSTSYSKTVAVERGVRELKLLETYPNPASQRATLRYAVPERQKVTIYLYDVLGRRVRTVVDREKEGRQETNLELSNLSSGVYFLRLSAGNKTRTRKLTVVH
jgi:hypothetical protein